MGARCIHPSMVMVRATATGPFGWSRVATRPTAMLVCRSCGQGRLPGSREWFTIGKRYSAGAAATLVRVKGHPRSLPTHPARWT